MKTVFFKGGEVVVFCIYAYILTLVRVWTPQVVRNVFMRSLASVLVLSGVSASREHKNNRYNTLW